MSQTVGLICNCGGVESRVRKAFMLAGRTDWADIPVYKGKEGVQKFYTDFPSLVNSYGASVLNTFFTQHHTYALVVGISNDDLIFANASGSAEEQIQAQVIASKFV